jgi:hypothetical protein
MPISARRSAEAVATAAAAMMIIVAVASASLTAQWLNYPTAGVPKTPAGSPNLNAATPRMADGKPDLSGLWEPEKTRPCPPGGCQDQQVGEQFIDIGWGLKGGLPYQPWAADLMKARRAEMGKGDPISRCLPIGVPRTQFSPFLKKILHVPGLVAVLDEQNMSYRQIFTDGRPLLTDPYPSWNGYSSGKWDGDTLVVETNGFRDGMWLDRNGSPMTDAARVTERIRRVNYGKVEIEVTVDDRKAYTAPWTARINHFLLLDTDLLDYVCLENEKDIPHLVGK